MLNEVTANTGIKLNMTTGLLTNYNSYGGSTGYWQTLGTVGGGVHITQIRPTLVWDLRVQRRSFVKRPDVTGCFDLHNAESERGRQYPLAICQALAVGGEG